MEIKQIGNFQAIALILIIVINHLVLGTPRTLIAETGTGTILNMFYVFLVTIILVFIVTKLFNNFKGKDIVDISEFRWKSFKIYSRNSLYTILSSYTFYYC